MRITTKSSRIGELLRVLLNQTNVCLFVVGDITRQPDQNVFGLGMPKVRTAQFTTLISSIAAKILFVVFILIPSSTQGRGSIEVADRRLEQPALVLAVSGVVVVEEGESLSPDQYPHYLAVPLASLSAYF